MKIAFVDVYPSVSYRICKDNNGGYGTANNLGDGFLVGILKRMLKSSVDFPPIYVATCMAILREQGHSVFYTRDVNAISCDLAIVVSSIVAHETELDAISCLDRLGIATITIGPFASSVPGPYRKVGSRVVIGEPESFFLNYKLTKPGLNLLAWEIPAGYVDSVDLIPMPAWDLIIPHHTPRMSFIGAGASLPIIASRGCPYSCSYYCTYPLQQGKKIRAHSVQRIIAEICHWHDSFGITNFQFRDPVFTIRRSYTEELCHELIKLNRNLTFAAEFHLKDIDASLARLMARAGFNLAFVGIESVTDDVLKASRRMTISVDQQKLKIETLQAESISVKAMFIFGLPEDNKTTVRNAIDYAKNLKASYGQFCVFTPYPGTPAYKDYESKIVTNRYEDYTQWQLVFQHPQLSAADIRNLLTTAYIEYYFNARWISRFLYDKLKNSTLFKILRTFNS
jgi:radical SAM superfamily enzyme YgiQ (UPF0313 family)